MLGKFEQSTKSFHTKFTKMHKLMWQLCKNLSTTPFIVLKIHEITILTLVVASSAWKTFLWLSGKFMIITPEYDHRKRFWSLTRTKSPAVTSVNFQLCCLCLFSGLNELHNRSTNEVSKLIDIFLKISLNF